MVNGSRVANRRIDQEQSNQYKRIVAFVIFLIITLTMITATFLNPLFMKKQIRTSNNQAVIVRQVNNHFDYLADLIGADHESDSNLLTIDQTQPIADHIIDYTLGLHMVRLSNKHLASQILADINHNIDQGASSDAQTVRNKLKKQHTNALYFVNRAFDLNIVTLGANLAVLLFVVNIILIIVTVITLVSLIKDMNTKMNKRFLVHSVTAAGMWSGFWLILIFGILAIIPVIFNVEGLPFADLGYLLEIGSSIFLDFVISGVILYILCAIPWQITTTN